VLDSINEQRQPSNILYVHHKTLEQRRNASSSTTRREAQCNGVPQVSHHFFTTQNSQRLDIASESSPHLQSWALTSSRMISGPKVDLYVGPSKKHYHLPKLLLCHYSDFFDSCFNGGFIETLSQTLYLPEDRIEDFEILLEFMLRGTSPGSIKLIEVSIGPGPFSVVANSVDRQDRRFCYATLH
jgi:hypothetical protein